MAAGIINALCRWVANNVGITVWDGEVHRYDPQGQTVGPDSSGGSSDWPVVKFSMPPRAFKRHNTFEPPYYDQGIIVCQIWHNTREEAEKTMDRIEAPLNVFANWTAISALIPSPYRGNPHYIVSLLLDDWASYQVEGVRTQKSELIYTCEMYYAVVLHGSLPVTE